MQNKLKIIKTMLFALALASASLCLSQEAQAADWFSPDWQYRKAITVDNTSNANALTNYQVLVTLNAGNFDYAKANADGSDLRFTSSDGLTEISYWVKEWNTSGDSKIWVKVPVVPALSSTTIYLYYGDALAVTSLSSFDGTMQKLGTDASTAGLWHFDEGTGIALGDSSVNANDGALNYFAIDDSEWIADSAFSTGGAISFDGVDDYIEVAHDASLNLGSGDFTIEGWVNLTATGPSDLTVINKYEETINGERGVDIYLNNRPNYSLRYDLWNGVNDSLWSDIIINDGKWHYFSVLRESLSLKIYIDGEFEKETPTSAESIDTSSSLLFGSIAGSSFFNGQLDEFRISTRALTAEEIKADYERRQYAAIEPTNALGTIEETDPYDGSATIVAADGGTVTNTADTVSVIIPANALGTDTEITIEASEAIGDFQVQGIAPIDYIYTFGPEGTTFLIPVTLTFDYDDTGMTLEEEQTLDIYWYNEDTELWESQGAIVDMDANTLTISVDHFSSFVIGINILGKIDELLLLIDNYYEQGKIEKSAYSLSVNLKMVQRLVAEGKIDKAIDTLEQFIEKVERFTPDKIEEIASGVIIDKANEIIGLLQ